MTQSTKNRIPGPLYAAAGAGDLAYQKLRKLPAVLGELTGKAAAGTADLREKAAVNSAELREKAAAGTAELREAALRNAAAVVAGAQVAQEKASAVYEELVARGARVIGGSAQTVSADAELESEGAVAPALPVAPEAPAAAKPAAPAATKPAVAKPVKKATKRTRPVAAK
jgi:heparin binding hemagglutinin HbhA